MVGTMTENRLNVGDTAPAFALADDAGNTVSLADYAGQRVLVYFYPRANARLVAAEREQAVALSQALFALQDGASREEAEAQLASSPGVTVDYLTVVDPATLEPVDAQHRPALALVAAHVGPVRLIDNLVLEA